MKAVTTVVDLHPQATFHLAQVGVELATQGCQSLIIGRLERKASGIRMVVQDVKRIPAG